MHIRFLLFATVFACWACASDQIEKSDVAPAVEAPTTGFAPEGLASSNLPQGECGMILWTLDDRAPVPIFRYVSGKSAEMVVNGRLVSLSRKEMSGASQFGVFEHQVFSSETGDMRTSIDAVFAMGFEGGVYLERGIISIASEDGWRTVVPSAGVAGCRGKN
jgi:hypothetical protein